MDLEEFRTKFEALPDADKKTVEKFVNDLIEKHSIEEKPFKRKAGTLKGMFQMSGDFDEPLEDFKDYM